MGQHRSKPTFHHIRDAAVGVNAANVLGVGWVGAAIKDEGCREGRGTVGGFPSGNLGEPPGLWASRSVFNVCHKQVTPLTVLGPSPLTYDLLLHFLLHFCRPEAIFSKNLFLVTLHTVLSSGSATRSHSNPCTSVSETH